jgi:hypothetical protein
MKELLQEYSQGNKLSVFKRHQYNTPIKEGPSKMQHSNKKFGTSNEWPGAMEVKMSGKFDEKKEVVMEKYVREKMMDMNGKIPCDLMNKG